MEIFVRVYWRIRDFISPRSIPHKLAPRFAREQWGNWIAHFYYQGQGRGFVSLGLLSRTGAFDAARKLGHVSYVDDDNKMIFVSLTD